MGEVITFYSYKGGVGRSMALANVALLLARWGYDTLVVDWDLEAPGLENFFAGRVDMGSVLERPGIVDLLDSHQAEHSASGAPGQGADAAPPPRPAGFKWQDCIVRVKSGEGAGSLHLITAGRRDNDYFKRVRAFDVQEFYQGMKGGFFIEKLRREWKKAYNFVLIDSRTGITDIGGICTIQLPDILILLFTATEQGLKGAVGVAQKANAERQNLPFHRLKLLTVPVPTRFDNSVEYKLSNEWLDDITEAVSPFYADWLPQDVRRRDMLVLTKIPYQAYFSFGEKLSVEEEGGAFDPTGLAYALETLAALIARKLEDAQTLADNRDGFVRRALKPALEEKPRPAPEDVKTSEAVSLHTAWLASSGAQGRRADFSRQNLRSAELIDARLGRASFVEADLSAANLLSADLSGADFSGATMQGATLQASRGAWADFDKARLIDANFRGADLRGANFSGADLQGAVLTNADLRGARLGGVNLAQANLKEARLRGAVLDGAAAGSALGLTAAQLGGTSLADARLPDSLLRPEELSEAESALGFAQSLLLALVVLCIYSCYMVLIETNDPRLVTNGSAGGLGLGFRLKDFYLFAPVVLLTLFLFVNFNLQTVWERLAELPSVFPDGRTLDKRLNNWFASALTRRHSPLLGEKSLTTPQYLLFSFTALWLTPCVLLLFWFFYLSLHDWVGTAIHILAAAGAVGAAILFRSRTVKTLEGGDGDADGQGPGGKGGANG